MEIKVDYELSGAVIGINPDIKVSKGDVLIFELDAEGHPFWIKTVMGIGQGNAVTSGISGVGQGKTSGVLIWNTTTFEDGIYITNASIMQTCLARSLLEKVCYTNENEVVNSLYII